MKYLIALCLACLPFCLFAADAPAPSKEQKEVMQVTQDACQAFLKADVAAADALFAPEFTLVSSRAVVQSREDVMAEIRKADTIYSEFRNHSMNAHVFGDAAIVQGITSLKGKSGDQTFALDVRFTDTLIRTKGKWRLVVSHVTRIPD
ncbi:MAG TPA: nuclear transport factor 2 family protein [Steroidobacteraceae bacterium]|nr:nuclear transport factor 2 family protein [Steroidobacteraceae bacterium]